MNVQEATAAALKNAALRRQTEESTGGDTDVERRTVGVKSL